MAAVRARGFSSGSAPADRPEDFGFRISDFGFAVPQARIPNPKTPVGVTLSRMLTGRAVSDDFGITGVVARR
jgi:hypothetical protein